AAFEAAARERLRREAIESDNLPPSALIEALVARGLITSEDSEKLRECFHLRNMVMHGVRPDDLPPQVLTLLLELVRRLLQVDRTESGIRFSDAAFGSLYLSGLNQANLTQLTKQASQALQEVLGNLRGSVSEEWDLAKD